MALRVEDPARVSEAAGDQGPWVVPDSPWANLAI